MFRPNEKLSLLAALWGVANDNLKKLITNGGETDVKDMFKHSMVKAKDDSLINGAGADDVRKFLKGVVKANKAKGINVGFKSRKKIGVIDRVAGSFNVQSLRTRMLSRKDRYVFLGRAKRNNEVHVKMMKSMKGEDEEAQSPVAFLPQHSKCASSSSPFIDFIIFTCTSLFLFALPKKTYLSFLDNILVLKL